MRFMATDKACVCELGAHGRGVLWTRGDGNTCAWFAYVRARASFVVARRSSDYLPEPTLITPTILHARTAPTRSTMWTLHCPALGMSFVAHRSRPLSAQVATPSSSALHRSKWARTQSLWTRRCAPWPPTRLRWSSSGTAVAAAATSASRVATRDNTISATVRRPTTGSRSTKSASLAFERSIEPWRRLGLRWWTKPSVR